MSRNKIISAGIIIILLAGLYSCSVQKHLPEGEKLYRGASVKVEKNPDVKESAKSLSKEIKQAIKPKRNKFLLGQPYKVWWWYFLGEPNPDKEEKGFKAFLRRQFAEQPVLSSRIDTKSTAESMAAFMENRGYFHSRVSGDTTQTASYVRANYTAWIEPRYKIRNITWVSDSTDLLKELQKEQQANGLLDSGAYYTLSDISSERDRLDLYLKTKGYYFFNPDFIMAYADSTVGERKVDLYLNIKRSAPPRALHPYTINSMVIFPNYSLTPGRQDTSKFRVVQYDSLTIKGGVKRFKPRLFAQTITYRPGSLYSSRDQNTTLNRLINLNSFKFVKNTFEESKDTTKHLLNATYYLTPSKPKSFQAEIDGFSKENNALGAQVSVNWHHRNLFKGAEHLIIKTYGGFEVSFADSLRNNNNFRAGAEATLRLPRYAIPFLHIKENNFYPPNTNLVIGYELFRKQLFYTKNLFRFQYDFTWKKNVQKQYTLSPVSLSYVSATAITDTFQKQAALDPGLLINVFSESILGSFFSYTYNNALAAKKNKLYFNYGIDLSGNLAGLITGAKSYREKNILGVPFAQYARADVDVHFTRTLSNKWDWANRIFVGAGFPYGNSRVLPFSKQYIIGGSSSVRGFRSRNLGPGTHKPTAEDQRYFQIIGGDYKLLMNTELRIPITSIISTAAFIDAGNIWTKDTLTFGPQGKLTKNWWKEIAVAAGIGLRFDVNILVIRADLGIPFRKPYLPDGERWVFNQFDFGSGAWRRENLILNIALGLPF